VNGSYTRIMLAAVPPLGLEGAYNNIYFDLLCVA
jgi:hypothetical protein